MVPASTRKIGFLSIVTPDIPFIGATPDGITQCDCHGTGCVEVKCSSAVRDQVLQDVLNTGRHDICLKWSSHGALSLR